MVSGLKVTTNHPFINEIKSSVTERLLLGKLIKMQVNNGVNLYTDCI